MSITEWVVEMYIKNTDAEINLSVPLSHGRPKQAKGLKEYNNKMYNYSFVE